MSNFIDFEEQSKKIKMIAFDLDGVVTEGLVGYGEMGIPLFKQYNVKDLEAVNELKKFFTIVVVSADNSINYHLCRAKNIPFFHNSRSKKEALSKAMMRYGVTPEEVVYIGHSFSDIENCKMIPFSLCPSDAVGELRPFCHVLDCFAGYGAVPEVYELLKSEIIRRQTLDNE